MDTTDSNTDSCHEDDKDWDMLVKPSTNKQNGFQLIIQQFLQMEEEEGEDPYQMFDLMDEEGYDLTHKQQQAIRNRHKSRPRSKQSIFDHKRAYRCIIQDYLGTNALFNDGGFEMMFHIT